jgi:lipopolysaccharide/colanic/teichoic acid biosynthesis glycosyltransferase
MAKRGIDLVASLLGLAGLSPLILFIAILIKLDSPGSIFHRASRVGKDGRCFRIYKFRTMVADAASRGPGITARNDARVTRIGRILRNSKLDELPQLINVVKGEMSLVGPRPEDPRYVALYTPAQRDLLRVRPGMTSPASLNHRDEASILTGDEWERMYREVVMPRKLEIDLEYVQHATVWSDLGIIFRTVGAVFKT